MHLAAGSEPSGSEVFLNPWPSFGRAIFFALLGRTCYRTDGEGQSKDASSTRGRCSGGDTVQRSLRRLDGRRGGVMRSLLDTTANLCTRQHAGVLLFAWLWWPDGASR